MIDFVSCFGESSPQCQAKPDGYYENVQKTNAQGVELSLLAQLTERLAFSANYTSMDAENTARGTPNFGRSLARRPKETANAQVSYEWLIGLTTTVAVQHAGRSFDNASNSYVLDGYTLVDFRASYAVTDSLEVFGRVENAFNEDYETLASLRHAWPHVLRRRPAALLMNSGADIAAGRFAHHGGRLCVARSLFPNVPQPWIDLSTGINPSSYPAPRASARERNRLPEPTELARLEAVAAAAFNVDDPARVVATGGTESALRLLPYVVESIYGCCRWTDLWLALGCMESSWGEDDRNSPMLNSRARR